MEKINPNFLTLSRIVLAPVILVLQQIGTSGALTIALIVLLIAELTDLADGALARLTGQVSDLGKLLDPLADSIMRLLIFLGFMASGWMPLWMVAVIFARDIIVAYTRTYASTQGVVLAARPSGKAKAWFQAIAQIGTILGYKLALDDVKLPFTQISWTLLFLATLVTALSMFDYLYIAINKLRPRT